MAQCPCGSSSELDQCCGPIVAGDRPARTAEALMRSRYTAFVRGDLDHIDNTYASEKRSAANSVKDNNPFESVEWVGLDIFDTTRGGEDDETGTVHFAVRFKENGALQVHRERSNFRREEGKWFYVDGDFDPKGEPARSEKVGRNQPCPCGSGKKFKKCCGV